MIDPKKIEQLARQVHDAMPRGLREFGDDVEKKIRQVLQAQLTRMDLVNREEFDVQTQVLLRTREKLAVLFRSETMSGCAGRSERNRNVNAINASLCNRGGGPGARHYACRASECERYAFNACVPERVSFCAADVASSPNLNGRR